MQHKYFTTLIYTSVTIMIFFKTDLFACMYKYNRRCCLNNINNNGDVNVNTINTHYCTSTTRKYQTN